MTEVWKPVPGFEGAYEASDQGRVRSLDRAIEVHGRFTYTAFFRGRVLKPYPTPNGYLLVRLGKGNTFSVHRLVLASFVGPCPSGMETLHRNGDCSDNRLSNLRYGTPAENAADRDVHGTAPRGSRHGCAILDEDMVRQMRAAPGTLREVADQFGVHLSTVHLIKARKTWRHV